VAFLHLSKEGDLFDQMVKGEQWSDEVVIVCIHHITGIPGVCALCVAVNHRPPPFSARMKGNLAFHPQIGEPVGLSGLLEIPDESVHK
jgi:hypothetical protein